MSKSKKIKDKKIKLAETNDFDLTPQKMPKKSTLQKQLKMAKSLVNSAQKQEVLNEFDRLKFAVDLEKFDKYIKFNIKGLLYETHYPTLPPYERSQKDMHDCIWNISNKKAENSYPIYDEEEIDFLLDDEEYDIDTGVDTSLDIQTTNNQDTEYDYLHKNYAIDYKTVKKILGINDVLVCNKHLIIDLTGKFMSSDGSLGKIHKNNIKECLQRILDLNIITFDIKNLLKIAIVYIVDICADITYTDSEKVKKVITGVSSFFPLASNSYQIHKYGRSGLLMKKKSRKSGESFTLYHKGEELSYRNSSEYQNSIGKTGVELAKKTLRLEYKLYHLQNIREALNIDCIDYAIVKLIDVLNSEAKPILKILKEIEVTPEILKEKIFGFVENIPNIDEGLSEKNLNDIFLAERFIEILRDNNYDITRVRNHIKTEYSHLVEEKTIKKFNEIANLRNFISNFLLYRKPKSITLVLELLEKIYKYYGMDEIGGTSD